MIPRRTPGHYAVLLLLLGLSLSGCLRGGPSPTPTVPSAVPTNAQRWQTTPTAGDDDTPVPKLDVSDALKVSSPGGLVDVQLLLADGRAYYTVSREGVDVVLPSRLGFVFRQLPPLNQGFAIVDDETVSFDETWTQPWGEVRQIRNHYNQLRVTLQETSDLARRLVVVFRVYDDGVGFRYELPAQPELDYVEITDEETDFVLAGDHVAWHIPALQPNRYEYLYAADRLSNMSVANPLRALHTPLTMETTNGLYISIHEAALTDYASMTLLPVAPGTLTCALVPWSDGVKVRRELPLETPWRTIQIATSPGELITSYLILNLNEPNKLEDVSWIQPGKYVGIWWGMHIDTYTWGSGPRHGATTENALRYVAFAADYGFDGVLIEGWNEGWDGNWMRNSDRFEFTTPYADFDIEAVAAYAAERGVKIIGHHETAGGIANYERQMEEAFAFYRDLGVDAVKTGYVVSGQGIKRRDEDGNLVSLEWHHGQWMVQHYRKVVETAAEHRIMLNVHEPIKDTGIRRTYPNMLTREGARGQEYNAWSGRDSNPPEHTVILPFTRLLAGPMDFTPGIFDLLFDDPPPDDRVNTTLAKQLALYVVLYSPLHMAADLPENYVDQPAFQFIQDVPTDWEETRVLHAEIGDVVTIARQERGARDCVGGRDWYLGSITDENGRSLEAPLDFLEVDVTYVAEVYADGPDADWESNPLAIEITRGLVTQGTVYTIVLAPGGGHAVRFRPATDEDLAELAPLAP